MGVGNVLPHQNFTFENVNEFAIKKKNTGSASPWLHMLFKDTQVSKWHHPIHFNLCAVKPAGTVQFQKLCNYLGWCSAELCGIGEWTATVDIREVWKSSCLETDASTRSCSITYSYRYPSAQGYYKWEIFEGPSDFTQLEKWLFFFFILTWQIDLQLLLKNLDLHVNYDVVSRKRNQEFSVYVVLITSSGMMKCVNHRVKGIGHTMQLGV